VRTGDELVIVGNSIAALVAARERVRLGGSVMLLNPTKDWGGHFGGVRVGGYLFDFGMTQLEFTSFNASNEPDILTYNADVRGDCGRFTNRIHAFIDQLVPTTAIPTPQMVFRGSVYNDLTISNCFDGLNGLTADETRTIVAECKSILSGTERPPHHASRKAWDDLFLRESYETISRLNHGRTFHDAFLEELGRKVFARPTRCMMARYHRAAWLPLFWPETLLSQFSEDPQLLPETVFSYPVAGHIGAVSEALLKEIQATPGIEINRTALRTIRKEGSVWQLGLEDGKCISTNSLVWALAQDQLLRLAGQHTPDSESTRSSITLVFLAVASTALKRRFSTIVVLDKEAAIYRVTNQDTFAGWMPDTCRIIAELNPTYAGIDPHDEASLQARVQRDLVTLGLVSVASQASVVALRTLHNALIVPTLSNLAVFNREREAVRTYCPGVRVIGPSTAFLAGSLNDQILQGLKTAALSCKGENRK
jgi:hypothetical protein